MIGISTSTYYYKPKRSRLERAKEDLDIKSAIEKIREDLPVAGYRTLLRYLDRELCAAKELLMAGVELKEKYAHRWATRHERKRAARTRQRKHRETDCITPLSDENFYFIAGYTAGGFPYGTTWEEADEAGLTREL